MEQGMVPRSGERGGTQLSISKMFMVYFKDFYISRVGVAR
jgi:hypothetical protein